MLLVVCALKKWGRPSEAIVSYDSLDNDMISLISGVIIVAWQLCDVLYTHAFKLFSQKNFLSP